MEKNNSKIDSIKNSSQYKKAERQQKNALGGLISDQSKLNSDKKSFDESIKDQKSSFKSRLDNKKGDDAK